ncbi:hypothetical protein R3P38DRAFT_3421157 [Favolaschia claudopus]|uniref:Uncharacterized protein n=1 Tax=Favolaschia claudopus TaxID=2862362 RepID=A0AAW0D5R7_9AGAR
MFAYIDPHTSHSVLRSSVITHMIYRSLPKNAPHKLVPDESHLRSPSFAGGHASTPAQIPEFYGRRMRNSRAMRVGNSLGEECLNKDEAHTLKLGKQDDGRSFRAIVAAGNAAIYRPPGQVAEHEGHAFSRGGASSSRSVGSTSCTQLSPYPPPSIIADTSTSVSHAINHPSQLTPRPLARYHRPHKPVSRSQQPTANTNTNTTFSSSHLARRRVVVSYDRPPVHTSDLEEGISVRGSAQRRWSAFTARASIYRLPTSMRGIVTLCLLAVPFELERRGEEGGIGVVFRDASTELGWRALGEVGRREELKELPFLLGLSPSYTLGRHSHPPNQQQHSHSDSPRPASFPTNLSFSLPTSRSPKDRHSPPLTRHPRSSIQPITTLLADMLHAARPPGRRSARSPASIAEDEDARPPILRTPPTKMHTRYAPRPPRAASSNVASSKAPYPNKQTK